MKRSMTPWTTAAAAAALLALPAAGWTQTTQQPPASGAAQTQTPDQTARGESASSDEAREHLREARTALDRIDNDTLTGEAQSKIVELKRHFSALERSVGANDRASATGAAQRSERATEARGQEHWQTEVAAIDRLLSDLIGPAQGATGAVGTTGTAGTTGAVGTTGAAAAAIALDESSREALEDVRKHVAKFAAKKSGAGDAHPHRDVTDDTAAATATAAATTGTAQAGGVQTDTTAAQTTTQAQADTQAARRHLTEARNTLSEMTQLPAAAELSGEARTQISQLIANFNELITTQDNWRASYAKVTSNLDALLGPDSATAAMTGTTGTTGTGTAGTVGTSGTAAEDLDPELRQRLVELRRQLNEFERAAGGTSPAAADPSATGAAAGAMTGAVTPDPATAQDPTTRAQPQGAPSGHLDQGEMMRHIEAIEAILDANDPMSREPGIATGTTGTAGTTTTTAAPAQPPTGAAGGMAGEAVTLSRAQIEQLRLHLNQLRGLVQR